MRKPTKRIGEVWYNNNGSKITIIDYRNAKDIDVYFEEYDWVFKGVQYDNLKNGNVKCPYEKRYYGVGYVGEGEYTIKINGVNSEIYNTWYHMLSRCYNTKEHKKNPTYINCEVCDEWHNFQNFAKWYEENYYEIEGDIMCLDKDILIKGNKIYSPNNCIFAPNRINVLFVKNDKNRGEFPIGVTYFKSRNKLRVVGNETHNGIKKYKHLGYFPPNQVEEAFQCYKNYKEQYIKTVAEQYKDLIPQKLYDAMYRWEVEITD